MMKKIKFYKCNHCGNVVIKLVDSNVPLVCCGEQMQELTVNTVDASVEKHVPVVSLTEDGVLNVKIGSVPHPMTPEHQIVFIYVELKDGGIYRYLTDKPEATFYIGKEKPVAVYEYCNLHGLWKTDVGQR